jgi:MFS family permease
MRHRNFRLFFFGQLISVSGTWMQSTAQQWLVYRLTDSQLSLGVVTFAAYIPVLLLSLFMGVIVDRFQRRRLLLFTQSWFILPAGALALLTYFDIVQYWHIVLLAVLLGIGNALDMPARQTFYVDMVEREDLFNAIALNSSVFNGARIIGPALSGLLVATYGEAPSFAINALSYLAVITSLLMMRLPTFKPPSTRGTGLEELKQGLGFLMRDRGVLGLVSMIAASSVFVFPFQVLMPAFARDILKIGPQGFGALMAARGIGALAGAIGLAVLGNRIHKGKMLTGSRSLLTFGAAIVGLSKTPILSMAGMILAGYGLITQLAVTNTLIQLMVPDELRGRVMSTFTWALGGFWPLGSLLLGGLGDHLGAQNAVLLAAACSALLTILGRFGLPDTAEFA